MPIRKSCSLGQFFLLFYKMVSQSGETVEQTKETIKNGISLNPSVSFSCNSRTMFVK